MKLPLHTEQRINVLYRAILHATDRGLKKIYREHIKFLKSGK